MRRRLGIAVAIAVCLMLVQPPTGGAQEGSTQSSAQVSPGGGLHGEDNNSSGGTATIVEGGSAADATAWENLVDDQRTASRGRGSLVCTATASIDYLDPEWDFTPSDPLPAGFFSDPPEWALEMGTILLVRTCEDVHTGDVTQQSWLTEVPGPDPMGTDNLALIAANRLPFPLPEPAFAPPLTDPESFLLVNMPVWIWDRGWESHSRTATAGATTVTVAAEPVRLGWRFPSVVHDQSLVGSCERGDVAYNPAVPLVDQSTPCTFVFARPSGREPESAYQGEITVTYRVTWSSNVGDSGDLGEVSRTATLPVRVGEQQVLNQ